MGKIKWARVLANAGYSFFSILVGACSLGALLKLDIPLFYFLELALVTALFNAGLAFFSELKKQTEEKPRERVERRVEAKASNPGSADEKDDGHPVTRLVNAILPL